MTDVDVSGWLSNHQLMKIVWPIQEHMTCPDDRSKGPWKTPVVRKNNGKPIGVILTLTEQGLAELGLEIDSEEMLFYRIVDGRILVTKEKISNAS